MHAPSRNSNAALISRCMAAVRSGSGPNDLIVRDTAHAVVAHLMPRPNEAQRRMLERAHEQWRQARFGS